MKKFPKHPDWDDALLASWGVRPHTRARVEQLLRFSQKPSGHGHVEDKQAFRSSWSLKITSQYCDPSLGLLPGYFQIKFGHLAHVLANKLMSFGPGCWVLWREPRSVHLKSAILDRKMSVKQKMYLVLETWGEILLSVSVNIYMILGRIQSERLRQKRPSNRGGKGGGWFQFKCNVYGAKHLLTFLGGLQNALWAAGSWEGRASCVCRSPGQCWFSPASW